jgi:hypothetical protein
MPGYDQKVYDNRCAGHGHNIQPLVTEKAVDPATKATVENLEVLCTSCGMGLEEIRQQVIRKTRSPRKQKAPAEAPVA